jgi:3-hydroxyisobutyrate dehydrogenase-like beta-hydroxyacid dehydrogenase
MTTIGFVGLGTMGSRIAGRLIDTGHTVHGYNRTPERAAALVDRGLIMHGSPREVAAAADVVFSMVTDGNALEAITAGPGGILAGLKPRQVYVDMSTVAPDTSRALARHVHELGAAMLDAPVSGSAPAAEQGTLAIMVGGDRAAYERVAPLLHEIGATVTYVGRNGAALVMKLAVNISLAAQILAFSEGVLLAERGGIDRAVAVSVLTESATGSPMLKTRAPFFLDPPDTTWFSIDLMQKDLGLTLETAKQLDITLPTATTADALMTAAQREGRGDEDIARAFPTPAGTAASSA